MSVYTTQLRFLIESGYDIGLNDYPIYDENHRAVLNQKIIDHYFMQEIGAETAGLFKFFLNRNMREIMPYYNQLYESAAIKFEPLSGTDLVETLNENINTNSTAQNKGSGTNSGKNLFSETPQGLLQTGEIENENYLTNATLDSNTATTENNAQSDGKVQRGYTKNIKGSQYHNPSELLLAYRKTILNIDEMIVNDPKISKCFMLIY